MMWGVAVKLSSLKIFALKLALFSGMLAYMAVDLFIWHGPLWSALYAESEKTDHSDALASVYGEKITENQLRRYEAEQNWMRGSSESSPARRSALLMDMVRSTLLRMRTRYNDKNLPSHLIKDAEAEEKKLKSRAKSDEDFSLWLASQGLTPHSFKARILVALKSRELLERSVRSFCEVTDADVEKHYELLKERLTAPAHRHVQHIFLATLDKNPEKVRLKAQEALDKLTAGEADFATLAQEYSEDDRTYVRSGDLGEVNDDEHLALPELNLFGENALPANEPSLVQSRWGWHIILPGEITPARQLSLDEVRNSLRTAIQSAQYELAVQAYFDEAVREGFKKKHIQIHAQ